MAVATIKPALALQRILQAENQQQLMDVNEIIGEFVHEFLHGRVSTEKYSADYITRLFYIYGHGFAKKTFLIEESLIDAIEKKQHERMLELLEQLYYSLSNKHLGEEELQVLLTEFAQTSNIKIGNFIAKHVQYNSTFLQRLRFQSYLKVWNFLQGGIINSTRPPEPLLLACLLEYIRGVHVATKHTGKSSVSKWEAWTAFSPSIRIVLKCESAFIHAKKYHSSHYFGTILLRVKLDETMKAEEILFIRIKSIVFKMLRHGSTAAEITATIQDFCEHFNFNTERIISASHISARVEALVQNKTGLSKETTYNEIVNILTT